jgi:hypothetical protein
MSLRNRRLIEACRRQVPTVFSRGLAAKWIVRSLVGHIPAKGRSILPEPGANSNMVD